MEELLTRHPAEVDPKQLTMREWARVWWGCFWRATLITVPTLLLAGAFGFTLGSVAGVITAVAGGDLEHFMIPIQILGEGVGFAIGIVFFTTWLRWILKVRFGNLRLALLRIEVSSEPTTAIGQQTV